VLFQARRRHASRYVLAYHYLMGDTQAMRQRQAEVIAALRAAPPRLLGRRVPADLAARASGHAARPAPRSSPLSSRAPYRPIAVLPPARGLEVSAPRSDERTLESHRNPFLQPVSQGVIVVFERRPDA